MLSGLTRPAYGGYSDCQPKNTDNLGMNYKQPQEDSNPSPMNLRFSATELVNKDPGHPPVWLFIAHWHQLEESNLCFRFWRPLHYHCTKLIYWSGWQDSNLRHLGPKPSTLPNWVTSGYIWLLMFYNKLYTTLWAEPLPRYPCTHQRVLQQSNILISQMIYMTYWSTPLAGIQSDELRVPWVCFSWQQLSFYDVSVYRSCRSTNTPCEIMSLNYDSLLTMWPPFGPRSSPS